MLAGEMFYSKLVQVSVVQSGYIVTLSEQQALAQMYLVTILNPVPSSVVLPPILIHPAMPCQAAGPGTAVLHRGYKVMVCVSVTAAFPLLYTKFEKKNIHCALP